MNKRRKDLLLLGLAALAAVVSLYFAFVGSGPRIELGTYEALGTVTAEETAKLLGNQGRVLVIARDTGEDKNPSVEAQMVAFERTLKKHAGLSQVTMRFEATPLLMMATGGGVPPDHLARALQAHPDVRGLVLFCGLPPSSASEWRILRQRGIKTLVVSSFRPDYGELLEQAVIHRVITPRPEPPPPDAPPPRTLRERFDQDYAILEAADAAK